MNANPTHFRISYALPIVLSGILLGPVLAKDREIEPNDTLVTAEATGIAGTGDVLIVGQFLGNGPAQDADVDLYRLEIPADPPAVFRISAEATALDEALDPYLRLFNAEGMELLSNDDRDFGGSEAVIDTYLLEAGTYYLGVSAAANPRYEATELGSGRSGSTGLYTLHVVTWAVTIPTSPYEPNDELNDATLVTSDSFEALGEFIGDGPLGRTDVDHYRLSAMAGSRIQIRVRAQAIGSTLDPVLGVSGLAFCDNVSSANVDAALDLCVVNHTTLRIIVGGAGRRLEQDSILEPAEPGSVGPYDLSINVSPLGEGGLHEPNDSVLQATGIEIYQPHEIESAEGYIGDGVYATTRGDRDFFRFHTHRSGILMADVTPIEGSSLDPVVAFYDPQGRRLADSGHDNGIPEAHLEVPLLCADPHLYPEQRQYAALMVMGARQRFPNDPLSPSANHNHKRGEDLRIDGAPGSTGGYELHVELLTDYPPEPNDTLNTATETGIVGGGDYAASFFLDDGPCANGAQPRLDVDMWSVNVTDVPACLRVNCAICEFCQYPPSIWLRVFDAEGNELVSDSGWLTGFPRRPLQTTLDNPGLYYVGVSCGTNDDYDPSEECSGHAHLHMLDAIRISSWSLSRPRRRPEGDLPVSPTKTRTGITPLFATQLNSQTNEIVVLNPRNGQMLSTVAAPEDNFAAGAALAYDGITLLGLGQGIYPTLYSMDPDTGEIVDETIMWMGSGYYSDALAFGGKLYLLDYMDRAVHLVDRAAARWTDSINFDDFTIGGGLAALNHPPRLFVADAFNTGLVYEVNPLSHRITDSFTPEGARPVAMAGMNDGLLYISDWIDAGIEVLDGSGQSVDWLDTDTPFGSLAAQVDFDLFADFDFDGDVDLRDVASFQACFTGPGGTYAPRLRVGRPRRQPDRRPDRLLRLHHAAHRRDPIGPTHNQLLLPPGAGHAPAVQIRWSMGPTDDIGTRSGWNLDEVETWGTGGGSGG